MSTLLFFALNIIAIDWCFDDKKLQYIHSKFFLSIKSIQHGCRRPSWNQLETEIWHQKWTQRPQNTLKSCITLVYTLKWCLRYHTSFFSIWPPSAILDLPKVFFSSVFFPLMFDKFITAHNSCFHNEIAEI